MNLDIIFKKLRQEIALFFLAVFFILITSAPTVRASVKAVYVGNDFYPPITNGPALKASGFNTLLLFAMTVNTNGDIYYNGVLVVQKGSYVGDPNWGAELGALRPTVNRIEFVIGGAGDPSFTYIENLIATNGTGPASILCENFQALKNATGVDAIQYDDEQTYNVSSAVAFGRMNAGLGMKTTLCPYTEQGFWTSVKSQLGTNVDAVYLQCYAGGVGNDPGQWDTAFGGFKVYPGLWVDTSDCPTITSSLLNWRQTLGISGGFIFMNGFLPVDGQKWGQSLAFGLDLLNGLIAEDSATNYFATGFTANEGFGFGAWNINTTGGGNYISGDNPALFGLWNSAANAQSKASRVLNTALSVGQSLLVRLQMNNLDGPGNTNAFQLQDASGNVLFGYWHQGGDNANGHYTDATGTHMATGFAYDYNKTDTFIFTLNSSTSYTFTDISTGTNFNGTLSGLAISQVNFLRANGSSGTTSGGNDFKFNGLAIYAPTNLPVALASTDSGWDLNFAATPCLTYRVLRSTNVNGPWTNIGSVAALFNSGAFNDTNSLAGRAFYRTVTP
ncbi:MAG TPA: hypothetical protein VGJ73_20395 [Verrucomicrobiae bacterium]